MTSPCAIFIPARMQAARLPGKPLADIAGLPMIVHVLQRAIKAGVGDVYVACAEEEIARAVEENGGKAVLTDPALPTGTDRIFAAFRQIKGDYDVVINLQGDLPTIDPSIVSEVLRPLENKNVDIATLVAEITDPSEKTNPNVVKAVLSFPDHSNIGRALYFTRSTAPYGDGPLYHHIGIYAYRREALETFVSLPVSPLEKRERLEQLRALEHGLRIDACVVDTVPLGVDSEEDLAKARAILNHRET